MGKRRLKPWEVLGEDGLPLQLELDFEALALLPDPPKVEEPEEVMEEASALYPDNLLEVYRHAHLFYLKAHYRQLKDYVHNSINHLLNASEKETCDSGLKVIAEIIMEANNTGSYLNLVPNIVINGTKQFASKGSKFIDALKRGAAKYVIYRIGTISGNGGHGGTIMSVCTKERGFYRFYHLCVDRVMCYNSVISYLATIAGIPKELSPDMRYQALADVEPAKLYDYAWMFRKSITFGEPDVSRYGYEKDFAGSALKMDDSESIDFSKIVKIPIEANPTNDTDYLIEDQLRSKWEQVGWIAYSFIPVTCSTQYYTSNNISKCYRGYKIYKLKDGRYRLERLYLSEHTFTRIELGKGEKIMAEVRALGIPTFNPGTNEISEMTKTYQGIKDGTIKPNILNEVRMEAIKLNAQMNGAGSQETFNERFGPISEEKFGRSMINYGVAANQAFCLYDNVIVSSDDVFAKASARVIADMMK